MYLREMLNNAVVTDDVSEGDLVLVSSRAVSWCDTPMVIRRKDWDTIFVTFRATEPDIEIIGKLLAEGRCKSFLSRFANEEEVRNCYQQLRSEQEKSEEVREDVSMNKGMTEGIEAGINAGINEGISPDEMPHPTGPVGSTGTVKLTPGAPEMSHFAPLTHANVPRVDILGGAFDAPIAQHTPPAFDFGENEEPAGMPLSSLANPDAGASGEPAPVEPETSVVAPATEEQKEPTSATGEPIPSAPSAPATEPAPEQKEPTPAVEEKQEEPAQVVEQEQTETVASIEETSAPAVEQKQEEPSPVETASEQATSKPAQEKEQKPEEPPALTEEEKRQEAFDFCMTIARTEHTLPNIELDWDGGLTAAFKSMKKDFLDTFVDVPVEYVITSTYRTVSTFLTKLTSLVANTPAVVNMDTLEDERQFNVVLSEAYIACLYFMLHGNTDAASSVFGLFTGILYEDGGSDNG